MQNNEPFFSVLVVTYNSEWNKTKQTLLSIIRQDKVSFEVVIADDGSKNNNFDKIDEIFRENNFGNYKLVSNKENQGTVKNFLSGLEVCSGQYVKPLSPGDFFYSYLSLYNALQFIKSNKASVYFGTPAFYSRIDNKQIMIPTEPANPKDLRPYLNNNDKLIKHNYFTHHDSIIGATVIYEKKSIKKYLLILSNFVKYAEDYSIYLMLANNEKIRYLQFSNDNNFFIWYEYNSGISTLKESKWHKILCDELSETFIYLVNNNFLPPIYYTHGFSKWKILRFLSKLILNPIYYFRKKILHLNPKQGWSKKSPDINMLEKFLND